MADQILPEIRVRRRNRDYADLLSVDYCGFVSELSAITQYINNETRICGERCSLARTLLGIAVAEMMHLQKLGELIVLLGGDIDFTAKTRNGCSKLWTPEYLSISEKIDKKLEDEIESENEALCQYEMHIKMIKDDCVNSVLKRIILDEEYHIMLLKVLKNER